MRTCAAKVQLPSECRISHSSQSTYFDAVALERGEVGLIGREGATTGQTAMCGVANMQFDRSAAEGVAEIMNGAGGHTPAATAPPTESSEFRVFGIAVNTYATSRIERLSNHNIE